MAIIELMKCVSKLIFLFIQANVRQNEANLRLLKVEASDLKAIASQRKTIKS